MLEDEARSRDIGLVAILFEEHPLQRLGTSESVFRNEPAAFREVPEDRVGLRQAYPVVELERRNPAVRVLGQELGVRVPPCRMSSSCQR